MPDRRKESKKALKKLFAKKKPLSSRAPSSLTAAEKKKLEEQKRKRENDLKAKREKKLIEDLVRLQKTAAFKAGSSKGLSFLKKTVRWRKWNGSELVTDVYKYVVAEMAGYIDTVLRGICEDTGSGNADGRQNRVERVKIITGFGRKNSKKGVQIQNTMREHLTKFMDYEDDKSALPGSFKVVHDKCNCLVIFPHNARVYERHMRQWDALRKKYIKEPKRKVGKRHVASAPKKDEETDDGFMEYLASVQLAKAKSSAVSAMSESVAVGSYRRHRDGDGEFGDDIDDKYAPVKRGQKGKVLLPADVCDAKSKSDLLRAELPDAEESATDGDEDEDDFCEIRKMLKKSAPDLEAKKVAVAVMQLDASEQLRDESEDASDEKDAGSDSLLSAAAVANAALDDDNNNDNAIVDDYKEGASDNEDDVDDYSDDESDLIVRAVDDSDDGDDDYDDFSESASMSRSPRAIPVFDTAVGPPPIGAPIGAPIGKPIGKPVPEALEPKETFDWGKWYTPNGEVTPPSGSAAAAVRDAKKGMQQKAAAAAKQKKAKGKGKKGGKQKRKKGAKGRKKKAQAKKLKKKMHKKKMKEEEFEFLPTESDCDDDCDKVEEMVVRKVPVKKAAVVKMAAEVKMDDARIVAEESSEDTDDMIDKIEDIDIHFFDIEEQMRLFAEFKAEQSEEVPKKKKKGFEPKSKKQHRKDKRDRIEEQKKGQDFHPHADGHFFAGGKKKAAVKKPSDSSAVVKAVPKKAAKKKRRRKGKGKKKDVSIKASVVVVDDLAAVAFSKKKKARSAPMAPRSEDRMAAFSRPPPMAHFGKVAKPPPMAHSYKAKAMNVSIPIRKPPPSRMASAASMSVHCGADLRRVSSMPQPMDASLSVMGEISPMKLPPESGIGRAHLRQEPAIRGQRDMFAPPRRVLSDGGRVLPRDRHPRNDAFEQRYERDSVSKKPLYKMERRLPDEEYDYYGFPEMEREPRMRRTALAAPMVPLPKDRMRSVADDRSVCSSIYGSAAVGGSERMHPPMRGRMRTVADGSSAHGFSHSRERMRTAACEQRSIHDSVHGSVHGSVGLSVHPSVHGSIHGSVHGSVYGSVHESVHGSVRGRVHPSVHKSGDARGGRVIVSRERVRAVADDRSVLSQSVRAPVAYSDSVYSSEHKSESRERIRSAVDGGRRVHGSEQQRVDQRYEHMKTRQMGRGFEQRPPKVDSKRSESPPIVRHSLAAATCHSGSSREKCSSVRHGADGYDYQTMADYFGDDKLPLPPRHTDDVELHSTRSLTITAPRPMASITDSQRALWHSKTYGSEMGSVSVTPPLPTQIPAGVKMQAMAEPRQFGAAADERVAGVQWDAPPSRLFPKPDDTDMEVLQKIRMEEERRMRFGQELDKRKFHAYLRRDSQ